MYHLYYFQWLKCAYPWLENIYGNHVILIDKHHQFVILFIVIFLMKNCACIVVKELKKVWLDGYLQMIATYSIICYCGHSSHPEINPRTTYGEI
jgi:hypothetical protein